MYRVIHTSKQERLGRISGAAGVIAGVIATMYVLFFAPFTVTSGGRVSRGTESGVSETVVEASTTTYHGTVELMGSYTPTNWALLAIPLAVLGFSLLGGVGLWTRRAEPLWTAVVGLLVLTVAGAMTIGVYALPSALLLGISGVLLGTSGDVQFGSKPKSGGPNDEQTPLSYFIGRDVLAVFLALTVPPALAWLTDLTLFSLLAVPSLVVLLGLSGIFNLLGMGEFVGTTEFYVLSVVWFYGVAVVAGALWRAMRRKFR